ncbi:MAG: rhomboid family intramembrane serine protease [Clostridiales bacterium]|nr:rhomboid family intramembrane serine protease [Clostridiales bacterium]
MKEKFQRDLINYFLSSGQFKVYELGQNKQNQTTWMVQGTVGQLDEIMVVTDRDNYELTKEQLREHINKSYVGNRGIGLTIIVQSSVKDGVITKDETAIHSDFVVASAVVQIDMEDLSLIQQIGYTNILQGVFAFLENQKRIQAEPKASIFTITNLIIAINVIIFIITAIASKSIFDINIYVLRDFGAILVPLIDLGEYYRLVTAMFLHGGLLHIVMNMYNLWLLGNILEKVYGKYKLAVIYFFSGIVGSFFSYLFLKPSILSVGASGAIFGLLGSCIVFALKRKNTIRRTFLQSIFQVLAINLIIGFSISNIDNAGHIGGLIGGLLITAALDQKVVEK